MLSWQKRGKKSGATYRGETKQRMEEDKRLGSFMDGFLQCQSCEELCNDDAHGSGIDSIAHTTCAGNETRNSTNAGGTKHLQVAVKNRHQSLSHISICNNAAVSVPALDSTNLVSGAAMIHADHANDADVSVPALDSTNLVPGAAMISSAACWDRRILRV